MKEPEKTWIRVPKGAKLGFTLSDHNKEKLEELNEYIHESIMATFSVDKFYMSSCGVMDPTIEAINSSEPDILDENTSYREERKVN